jgi:hypothetical protein
LNMSSHVKTGEEIYQELIDYADNGGILLPVLEKQKWVPLYWLKEQIKTYRIERDFNSYWIKVDILLSLLDEKENKL